MNKLLTLLTIITLVAACQPVYAIPQDVIEDCALVGKNAEVVMTLRQMEEDYGSILEDVQGSALMENMLKDAYYHHSPYTLDENKELAVKAFKNKYVFNCYDARGY